MDSFEGQGNRSSAPTLPPKSAAETIQIKAEAERIKAESRTAGYNDGLSKGYADGLLKAEDEYREKKLALGALAENMARQMADLEVTASNEMLLLALEIAKAMTLREIESSKEILVTAIRRTLRQIPSQRDLIMHVHSSDCELIQGAFSEQINERNWQVCERDDLSPGDFVIETKSNHIDGRLSSRWDKLMGDINLDEDLRAKQMGT
jgi:flagellar assembly protein FliH